MFRALKWIGGIILVGYIVLVIGRMFYFFAADKTKAQVAKIHATKLTLDDVMGKHLPPDPGAEADKTVQGVDANQNGIRDDVELAIFKEYPNSAKTRAALLQYALALQMEMTQKIVNAETVGAVAEQKSRGYLCIGEITSRNDKQKFIEIGNKLHSFVETKQLNTDSRKRAREEFYKSLKSGDVPNDYCDLTLSTLPN